MIKEIIRIEADDNERPYHLLVTRKSTDDPDLEDICVEMHMTIEERERLIQHLKNINHIEQTGFCITFGVRTKGPDVYIREFTERIKKVL